MLSVGAGAGVDAVLDECRTGTRVARRRAMRNMAVRFDCSTDARVYIAVQSGGQRQLWLRAVLASSEVVVAASDRLPFLRATRVCTRSVRTSSRREATVQSVYGDASQGLSAA